MSVTTLTVTHWLPLMAEPTARPAGAGSVSSHRPITARARVPPRHSEHDRPEDCGAGGCKTQTGETCPTPR